MDYMPLNDNTNEDGYCIPDKEALINKIQNNYWHSKFDLKLGFWRIKMHVELIPWTSFIGSEGHYEWLFMTFGFEKCSINIPKKNG